MERWKDLKHVHFINAPLWNESLFLLLDGKYNKQVNDNDTYPSFKSKSSIVQLHRLQCDSVSEGRVRHSRYLPEAEVTGKQCANKTKFVIITMYLISY